MHKLSGCYQEGNCKLKIEGGEPVLLVNTEKLFNGEAHCDFVYICLKDGIHQVFIVEMKGIRSYPREKGEIEKFWNKITAKFINTDNKIEKILKDLKFNQSKKVNWIFVIPAETKALMEKEKIRVFKEFSKKNRNFELITCGKNVWGN